ncbi:MAG: methionyl-tRNA formyltransferase [Phycisphaerales bacterium]|nr:methionyl-tRNA formyltransferase [Phycisphaerales bacterium]
MRLVLFGSGIFGVPTFRAMSAEHEVLMVVSQPDRPAGRGRSLQPTPVSQWARDADLPCLATDNVNTNEIIGQLQGIDADGWIVIAFGQKLAPDLLSGQFAVNLHASLLPRFRGAAPINWAIINGERETGLSVITLADRIDAGDILAQCSTPIDPDETAGELHDRLSEMGPEIVGSVLGSLDHGSLDPRPQSSAEVIAAPKLSRKDATVDFDRPAIEVRNRIHGLTPWPGCDVLVAGRKLRLLRAAVAEHEGVLGNPGCLRPDHSIACGSGSIRLHTVQPPGGRPMDFDDWCRGLHDVQEDALMFTSTDL